VTLIVLMTLLLTVTVTLTGESLVFRPAPLWRSCRLQRASPDKIYAQTASADPTLHAQLHRATMFPARNSPPHCCLGFRFPKNGTLLKGGKGRKLRTGVKETLNATKNAKVSTSIEGTDTRQNALYAFPRESVQSVFFPPCSYLAFSL
jgi:hypothetical protein